MLNEAERRGREEMIYNAVLCLMEQGADLNALTVSRIAAAAGIGKGTVYEYFASKRDIVAGLTKHTLEREIAMLSEALRPCVTLETAIAALCGYLRGFAGQRGVTYRILTQMIQRDHEILPTDTARELEQELQGIALDSFVRLRAAGEIAAALDDGYCSNAVMAACAACMLRLAPCHATEEAENTEAALRNMAHLLRRALG